MAKVRLVVALLALVLVWSVSAPARAVVIQTAADAAGTDLTLTSPAQVAGGEAISVIGTLAVRGGGPVSNAVVDVSVICNRGGTSSSSTTARTDSQGSFTLSLQAGACDQYVIGADYAGDHRYLSSGDRTYTEVIRETWSMVVTRSASPVLPGGDLTFTTTFTDGTGAPVVGAQIDLTTSRPDQATAVTRPTTDAAGQVVVELTDLTSEGSYCVEAEAVGDVVHRLTFGSTCGDVSRLPSALTIDGPTLVHLLDDVVVTGRLTGVPGPTTLDVTMPGGTKQAVRTDDEGRYRVPTRFADLGFTTESEGTLVVAYAGDALHRPSVADVKVSVQRVLTRIELDQPDPATVGDAVPVTGRLVRRINGVDQPFPGPVTLTLSSSDEAFTFTTADDGTFTTWTTPQTDGTRTVTVLFAGDLVHYDNFGTTSYQATKIAPLLSLRSDRTSYVAGEQPQLSLDIARSQSRQVTLVERRASGDVLVYEGPVPEEGLAFSVPLVMTTRRYVLSTPADAGHATASVSVSLGVRLRLATRALSPTLRDGSVAVYGRSADPVFRTTSTPVRAGACMRQEVQRRVDGVWRAVATSTCRLQSSAGVSQWRFTTARTVGRLYRVRSVFAGDKGNLATRGPWTAFRFR